MSLLRIIPFSLSFSLSPEIKTLFSRVLPDSTPGLVCWSVGQLVGLSVTSYFFYDFYFLSSLLLPKWSSDLKYDPCPPARDLGSRLSGLVPFLLGIPTATRPDFLSREVPIVNATIEAFTIPLVKVRQMNKVGDVRMSINCFFY